MLKQKLLKSGTLGLMARKAILRVVVTRDDRVARGIFSYGWPVAAVTLVTTYRYGGMREQTARPCHARIFVTAKAIATAAIGVIESRHSDIAHRPIAGMTSHTSVESSRFSSMEFSTRPTHAHIGVADRAVLSHKVSGVGHAIDYGGGQPAQMTIFARGGLGHMSEASSGPCHSGIFMATHAVAASAEGMIERRRADQTHRPPCGVAADTRGGRGLMVKRSARPHTARIFVAAHAIALSALGVIKRWSADQAYGPLRIVAVDTASGLRIYILMIAGRRPHSPRSFVASGAILCHHARVVKHFLNQSHGFSC